VGGGVRRPWPWLTLLVSAGTDEGNMAVHSELESSRPIKRAEL